MWFGLWRVKASWKAEVMVLLEYGEAIRGWHDHTTEHKQIVAPQTDNSATAAPRLLQAEPGLLFPSKCFFTVMNGQERGQI